MEYLNKQQKEVVHHRGSPLVCFAAAGTGKTQSLTCRIASLIKDDGVEAQKIIALTFTTKAAKEMKERASTIAQISENELKYVSTFHSFCLKLLREFSDNPFFKQIAQFKTNERFNVIEPKKTVQMLKLIIEEETELMQKLNQIDYGFEYKLIDEKAYYFLNIIEKWRNDGYMVDDVQRILQIEKKESEEIKEQKKQKIAAAVYEKYRSACGKFGFIDFSDLILIATRLLETDKKLRLYCRSKKFHHLLIDEFQDTCPAQMNLINVLCRSQTDGKLLLETGLDESFVPQLTENNLMVVGDDYQAIHEWRGASVKHILDFEKTFDNVRTIILGQNYRSYQEIINAASNVIKNNKNQKHKSLTCSRFQYHSNDEIEVIKSQNDVIKRMRVSDQFVEGSQIAQSIDHYVVEENGKFQNCAILYRTHALSQPIEEKLKAAGIPYVIKGSISFFERAEIKFAMGCMRFLLSQDDDALQNILLTCGKQVGAKKIDMLKKSVQNNESNLWDVVCEYIESPPKIKGKRETEAFVSIKHITETLKKYIEIVYKNENDESEEGKCNGSVKEDLTYDSISTMLESLLTEINYIEILKKERENKKRVDECMSNDRLDNLQSLYSFISKNENDMKSNNKKMVLSDLMDIISVDSVSDTQSNQDDENNKVVLMTLHSSKGLEWPFVIMAGCDEGTLPFIKGNIEEERRLFYVGVTRAKDKLFLTCPSKRLIFNKMTLREPSRFLSEMDSVS